MEVLQDDTLNIGWSHSAPGWNGFDFDTPYVYDGSGNLVVEFRYMGSTGTTINTRAAWASPADRCLDGGWPTCPTGELMSFLTGMRLHYDPTGIHHGSLPSADGLLLQPENPFRSTLSVDLAAPAEAEATLHAYSLDGRLVQEMWSGFPGQDILHLELDSTDLPGGLVILMLESSGTIVSTAAVRIP